MAEKKLKMVVVTATTNSYRAYQCTVTWGSVEAGRAFDLIVVVNRDSVSIEEKVLQLPYATHLVEKSYLGSVPAFRRGVDYALDHTDADLIACLHDDLEILDPDWVRQVVRRFESTPTCGLAGFGGAIGWGDREIYQRPYNPMQLARVGFRSNLTDAESHGMRSLLGERVACLDGFSLIGRREFFDGRYGLLAQAPQTFQEDRPWTYLEDHGIIHHAYDSAMGGLAARLGWDTYYIPVRCHHLGGQTAVGDAGYQTWAQGQIPGGDQGFWEQSHRRVYELFTDVLPLRV